MAGEFRQLRGELLSMDLREIGKLYEFFKRCPKLVRPAVAQMLNDLAFRWRPLAVSTLASRLIMRNPKFILSRMVVQKTSAKPIPQQAVIVGSTYVKGKGGSITFDGFRSLQGLAPETRNRTLGLLARGGDKRAKAKPSGKLMPDADIPKPEDWDDVRRESQVQAMIRAMASSSVYGKRMIIPRGYGMAPGLYRIKSKRGYILPATGREAPRLAIVQHFDRKPYHATFRWMQESVKRLLKHAPMAKMWDTAMDRVMSKARMK